MDAPNKRVVDSNIVVLVLVLIIFALGAYLINSKNSSTPTTESLFDKQERCANNRDNAQKQLEESYKLATPYFYDIFYSQKTGTCVYTYGLVLSGESPNEIGSFVIADYFTGEQLFSIQYDNSSNDESKFSYTVRPQFEDKVAEYKK